MKAKVNNNWVDVKEVFSKVNNVWVPTAEVWSKIDGKWVRTWVKEIIWGSWSKWYDYEIKEIPEQRQVQSEQQHKYQNYSMCTYGENSARRACWDKNANSPGDRCSKCDVPGRFKNEWGHYRGSWWRPQWNAYECIASVEVTKNAWNYNGVKDAKSDWTSGGGSSNTSTYRVTDRRTAWRYRDRTN